MPIFAASESYDCCLYESLSSLLLRLSVLPFQQVLATYLEYYHGSCDGSTIHYWYQSYSLIQAFFESVPEYTSRCKSSIINPSLLATNFLNACFVWLHAASSKHQLLSGLLLWSMIVVLTMLMIMNNSCMSMSMVLRVKIITVVIMSMIMASIIIIFVLAGILLTSMITFIVGGARRVPGVNLLFWGVSRIARLQGRGGLGGGGGGAVTTFYDRTQT